MKIHRSAKSLTEELIAEVETRLDIRLPQSYRQFLLKHNGGRPEPSAFRYGPPDAAYKDSEVDWFLSIRKGKIDSFEDYFRVYKIDERRIPDHLVPIAHDPGGNLICISIKGDTKGAIFFWDHEREGVPESIAFVSRNLDSFLSSLSDLASSSIEDVHSACEEGDLGVVEAFLSNGGTPEARDENGKTLLEQAAIYGHSDLIRLLIGHGASFGNSLELAAQNGNLRAVRTLLEAGADVNGQKKDGGPLRAAASNGETKVVEFLIAQGADVRPKKIGTDCS